MNNSLNNIKKPGFKVPDGYFDQVEEAVFSQIKTEAIKESVNDSGFKAPDNYFDAIEDQVFDTIKSTDTPVVSLFNRRNLYYVSGIAAAILILFAVFVDRNGETPDELNYEVVEDYILDQDLSSYEIASLLSETGLESLELEIQETDLTEESLEEYLLENLDLEDIIEQ
ncbi:MAG: hypothetical protein HKN00_12030 [Flavobacteriaceae bacterium]|nr:hypothetical protein [Bacteroidia bacterium]MBT8288206.1 hypothetical protein [Bacteroidia bacterium]NNF75908.1 hypothetical protein [Flavobacteriaceae bacterium]NNK72326.1 hypothetical protein [Flavobacteriaceae bacterium]